MRNKNGMTLIEVIASIILLLICIGGITALLYQSTETSHCVYYTYVAANLAKNRVELIRELRKTKGYMALADLPETQIELIDYLGNAGGDFERTTQVEYASGLTKVTVSVECKKEELNHPVVFELVTLLSSYL
ncbi:MAG: prepilin-type N-terminal cleavage/methylation domain-containing protein [Candidatus Ratteibacteria bacterium]|nr:prepilin-type N-terminal cleavage/methylation domain-containing protein [Candidatus Ratteibacteria bacterium]